MGGSFALALKAGGQVSTVVGWSRTPASARQALELGVVDEVAGSASDAVRGADVVLLAVPVASTGGTLAAIVDALSSDALCMDVGSTKTDVVEAARDALGARAAAFVPAHPIAGKEKAGVAHADAALYRGCRTILTPVPGLTDPICITRARALWESIGARVTEMGAADHDDALAAVSHLPHLIAFAFMRAIAAQPHAEQLLSLAGPGFRDFTRIAAGDPTLWRDVLLANREAVAHHAHAFRVELDRMEAALSDGDASALRRMIEEASARREAWTPGLPAKTPGTALVPEDAPVHRGLPSGPRPDPNDRRPLAPTS